jgi:hypothetical protein
MSTIWVYYSNCTETNLLTGFGEHYLRDGTVIAEENFVQGSKQWLVSPSPFIIIISAHGTQQWERRCCRHWLLTPTTVLKCCFKSRVSTVLPGVTLELYGTGQTAVLVKADHRYGRMDNLCSCQQCQQFLCLYWSTADAYKNIMGYAKSNNSATCRVVHVTKMMGSSSDDWIY